MKKAARTNTKYMMRLDNLIWFSPFFLFFFLVYWEQGDLSALTTNQIEKK
jgi:hypothetical protein